MESLREILVDRSDLRRVHLSDAPARPLQDGEVRVAIERFALTANNVSYATAGDMIGYWNFYPANAPWGKVPVWGFADVTESRCEGVPVGDRIYGFFPMANQTVLQPGKIRPGSFTDVAAHREALPGLYNVYARTAGDPALLKGMDNERCLFFPLFITSFVLADYLADNDFFGARQVIIGSASSKTALGLAMLLSDDPKVSQRIVGVTSPANVSFLETLGAYDQIVTYGSESAIDATLPAAFVDMAGNGQLTVTLHTMLADNMVESCQVGATHWNADRRLDTLPGAKPAFFFAPSQIAKRDGDWGPGVVMAKATEASARLATRMREHLTIEHITDRQAAADLWVAMLDNKVAPNRGLVVSL